MDKDGYPLESWNGKPKLNVEDHTWLEIVYKPSLEVVIFDPSFNYWDYPLDKMYAPMHFHISGKPQCVYGQRETKIPQKIFDPGMKALGQK